MNKNINFIKNFFYIFLLFIIIDVKCLAIKNINSFDPIFERDQEKKEEVCNKAIKRFVIAPIYIYIDGEVWEKIYFTILISSTVFFNYLSKKNSKEKFLNVEVNMLSHIFIYGLFISWFFVSPITVFINYKMNFFEKKFNEINNEI